MRPLVSVLIIAAGNNHLSYRQKIFDFQKSAKPSE
jgi:hypothetical protein